jgi:hypothetical protein
MAGDDITARVRGEVPARGRLESTAGMSDKGQRRPPTGDARRRLASLRPLD